MTAPRRTSRARRSARSARALCVYCGASTGNEPAFLDAARSLGRELAVRDVTLVYGGGGGGLMGAVADAVLAAGGDAVGVIPRFLVDRETAHGGLTALHVVETLHERKALMAELADGFVTLPGGLGTLDELAEMLTWRQLGLHDKPIVLLDVQGYFEPLVAFLAHAVRHGFLRESTLDDLRVAPDAGAALDAVGATARA